MADITITRITGEDGKESYRVEADGQVVRSSASYADLAHVVDEIYTMDEHAKQVDMEREAMEAIALIDQAKGHMALASEAMEMQRRMWLRHLNGHLISGKKREDVPEIEHVGYDQAQMGREK